MKKVNLTLLALAAGFSFLNMNNTSNAVSEACKIFYEKHCLGNNPNANCQSNAEFPIDSDRQNANVQAMWKAGCAKQGDKYFDLGSIHCDTLGYMCGKRGVYYDRSNCKKTFGAHPFPPLPEACR